MRKQDFLIIALVLMSPLLAQASVESSLLGLKNVLLNSILPVFAVMGLGFAGFSFFTGNPNAKQHLIYAITGSVICFGPKAGPDPI